MKDIENRLIYLFTGEFFAVVGFTSVYFYNFSSNNSYSLVYVLFILNFILLQGSFFWLIKWRRLKSKRTVLPNMYKFFIVVKKINFTLICIAPLIIMIDTVILEQVSPLTFLLIALVYVFTIIEHINYFHIQLTNYKKGRGKKASIAKEINNIKDKN